MKRAKRKKSETGGLRKMCPCAQRNWMACPHSWMLFKKFRGEQQVRVSLRTPDHAEAVKKRDEFLRTRNAGGLRTRTFGEVADLYLAAEHASPKSKERYRVEAAKAALGDKAIDSVESEDVEALRARWLAERKPGVKGGRVGVNRKLARLRHVFNWALRNRLATQTPFRRHGVAMIAMDSKAERARSRRLEGDEERRLLAATGNQLLKDLIVAAIETGCRKGELMSLQWQQVKRAADGSPLRIELLAEKTKTRTARTIPIESDRLVEILARRQRGPDGQVLGPGCYVFGTETGERRAGVRGAWEAACEKAGIEGLNFHDLRREFGSRLHESGAPLASVQAALGHANIKMTSTYLGTTDAGLREDFKRLQDYNRRRSIAFVADAPRL